MDLKNVIHFKKRIFSECKTEIFHKKYYVYTDCIIFIEVNVNKNEKILSLFEHVDNTF